MIPQRIRSFLVCRIHGTANQFYTGSDEIEGGKKKKREQELQANLKVMQLGMFPRQPGMRNKSRAVNFTISFFSDWTSKLFSFVL